MIFSDYYFKQDMTLGNDVTRLIQLFSYCFWQVVAVKSVITKTPNMREAKHTIACQ